MVTGAYTTKTKTETGDDRLKALASLYQEKAHLEIDLRLKELEIQELIIDLTDDLHSEKRTLPITQATRKTGGSLTNIGQLRGSGSSTAPCLNVVAGNKSLDQLVFEILQQDELGLAKLVETVMRSGFKTKATKFRNCVSQAILRLKSVKAVSQDKKTKEYSAAKNLGWSKVQERLSIRSKEMRQATNK